MRINLQISGITAQFLELISRDMEVTLEEAAERVLQTTAEGNMAIRMAQEYLERGIQVISVPCDDPDCPNCNRKEPNGNPRNNWSN